MDGTNFYCQYKKKIIKKDNDRKAQLNNTF